MFSIGLSAVFSVQLDMHPLELSLLRNPFVNMNSNLYLLHSLESLSSANL